MLFVPRQATFFVWLDQLGGKGNWRVSIETLHGFLCIITLYIHVLGHKHSDMFIHGTVPCGNHLSVCVCVCVCMHV